MTRQRLRAVFDEDAELYDRGEVVVSAFEDWPLPSEPFDALCAFTSWHWLDPGVRTAKAVIALRAGGTLATVTTSHVTMAPPPLSPGANALHANTSAPGLEGGRS